jgi:hypothetical protein
MAASRSNSPKTVQSVLSHSDGTLARLCAQAGELSRVNRLLTTLLPAPLAQHVRACAIHADTLVLQTDSPVWSTRLRLEQQRLLAEFRAVDGLTCINSLRVTVAVPATSREQQTPKLRLSATAAATLAQCAESQTDSALRAALARLSRRG